MNGNGVPQSWNELDEETRAQLLRASMAAYVLSAMHAGAIEPPEASRRLEELWPHNHKKGDAAIA